MHYENIDLKKEHSQNQWASEQIDQLLLLQSENSSKLAQNSNSSQPENSKDLTFSNYKSFFQHLNHHQTPFNISPDNNYDLPILTHRFVKKKNIKSEEINSFNQLKITLTKQSKCMDVVELICSLNIFRKKYAVLNQRKSSHRHDNKLMGTGTFSNVFECHDLQTDQANVVKCLKFDPKQPKNLVDHIKEFFIYDLISALEIGPKIVKTKGFDFIIFKDCIEFEMEKCSPPNLLTLENDIKKSLNSMHSLSLVHNDIKPVNIMFSPIFKKNVLIDFGVSTFVKQTLQEKAFTKFAGTYEFSGEEMKKIFSKKEGGLVNVYFNDVESLINTINYFNAREKSSETLGSIGRIENFNKNSTDAKIISANPKLNRKEQKHKNAQIIKESLIEFKFFTYNNPEVKKIQDKIETVLTKFNLNRNIEHLTIFIKQAISYLSRLDLKFISELAHTLLWSKPDLKYVLAPYLQYDLEETYLLEPEETKQAQDLEEFVQKAKFIYFHLQMLTIGCIPTKIDHGIESLKTYSDDEIIKAIENDDEKITTLKNEEFYVLFLRYCSFWKFPLAYDTRLKQSIAAKISQIIKKDPNHSKAKYLQSRYQPQLDFTEVVQLPNLTFVYGFLLSYCMEGETTKFKLENLPGILKNSLILGFQFNLFYTECLYRFYDMMIGSSKSDLLSTGIIESYELELLRRSIFYWSVDKDAKDFGYSEVPINQFRKYFGQQKLKDKIIRQKIQKSLLFIDLIRQYGRRAPSNSRTQQQVEQIIEAILAGIRLEYEEHQVHKIVDMIELAFYYLNCVNRQWTGRRIKRNDKLDQLSQKDAMEVFGFDIEVLSMQEIKLTRFSYHEINYALNSFDKAMNCPLLSANFFNQLRLVCAQKYQHSQQYFRIVALAIMKCGHPEFNRQIICQLRLANKEFEKNMKSNDLLPTFYKMVHRLKQCLYQLIYYHLDNTVVLIDVLQALMKLIHRNQNSKFTDFSLDAINFIESVYTQELSDQSKLSMVKIHLNCLHSLNPQFVNCRKNILILYRKMLNQFDLSPVSCDQLQRQAYQMEFFTLLFNKSFMFNQKLKFWQNLKLMKLIGKNLVPYFFYFAHLITAFLCRSRIDQIVQLIAFYCHQNTLTDCISEKTLLSVNQYTKALLETNELCDEFYEKMQSCVKIMKGTIKNRVNLIPMYFVLLAHTSHLEKQQKKWRKYLFELYELDQLLQQIKIDYKKIYNKLFFEYSQKYLNRIKSRNNARKKHKLLMRCLKRFQFIDNYAFYQEFNKFQNKLYKKMNIQRNAKIKVQKMSFLQLKRYKIIQKSGRYERNINYDSQPVRGVKPVPQLKFPWNPSNPNDVQVMNFYSMFGREKQFLERYNLKDSEYFYHMGIVSKFIDNKIREQKECDYLVHQMNCVIDNCVAMHRKDIVSQIIEQTVDVIGGIIGDQRERLLRELKAKKNMTEEDIVNLPLSKYLQSTDQNNQLL